MQTEVEENDEKRLMKSKLDAFGQALKISENFYCTRCANKDSQRRGALQILALYTDTQVIAGTGDERNFCITVNNSRRLLYPEEGGSIFSETFVNSTTSPKTVK